MSFVSYCFWYPLTAHIFGTDWQISMAFSAKCSCENNAYISIENWKINLTDFRLILLMEFLLKLNSNIDYSWVEWWKIIVPNKVNLNATLTYIKACWIVGQDRIVQQHDYFHHSPMKSSSQYLFYTLDTFVMWSSKMSRNSQILILRYRQIKWFSFFVSCCFCNPSTARICRTNCPISMEFSPN